MCSQLNTTMPSSSGVESVKRALLNVEDDVESSKRVKISTLNGDDHLENGLLKPEDELDTPLNNRGLRIDQLRAVLTKVLDSDYKNMTVKEFENLLLLRIADYFANYHPSLQLQRQAVIMQKKYSKLEEQFKRFMKHFYDMRYILKRMADQKKGSINPTDLPCRPIRSVAVQVQAAKCRGGDLCPGTASLAPPLKDVENVNPRRSNGEVIPRPRKTRPSVTNPAPTTPAASPSTAQPPSSSAQVIDLTDRDENAEISSSVKTAVPQQPKNNTAPNKTVSTTVDTSNSAPKLVLPSSKPVVEDSIVPIEKVQLPAPPKCPSYGTQVNRPPQPILKINKADISGILLSWTLKGLDRGRGEPKIPISMYQVFACQEINKVCKEWSPVGDVKALPLPMACTLSQFREGNRYHFIVRAVDKFNTFGEFSSPASIMLVHRNSSSSEFRKPAAITDGR